MTVKALTNYFEGYYGCIYTGDLRDTMFKYLENSTEEYLDAIASVIIKRFEGSFNKLPNVAVIEKNIDEINDYMIKAQDRFALPEPPAERASPEEAEMYMQQIKDILKDGNFSEIVEEAINKF